MRSCSTLTAASASASASSASAVRCSDAASMRLPSESSAALTSTAAFAAVTSCSVSDMRRLDSLSSSLRRAVLYTAESLASDSAVSASASCSSSRAVVTLPVLALAFVRSCWASRMRSCSTLTAACASTSATSASSRRASLWQSLTSSAPATSSVADCDTKSSERTPRSRRRDSRAEENCHAARPRAAMAAAAAAAVARGPVGTPLLPRLSTSDGGGAIAAATSA